jgi:hypothetical protein
MLNKLFASSLALLFMASTLVTKTAEVPAAEPAVSEAASIASPSLAPAAAPAEPAKDAEAATPAATPQAAEAATPEEPQAEASAERFVIELDGVNLRKGPSTDDEVIKPLEYGSAVLLKTAEASPDGLWSLVDAGGDIGYVKREYLGMDKPPEKPKPAVVVEHLTWSEAKGVMSIGVPAKILDIRTGAVYYVKSFSNGMHADVEPVTAEDTAIMKRTYNNRWDWDGRPVWVTINGRTIAAAINGMPHGGGVNSSNGMNGQVCLHFWKSSVHNGNRSYERQLQAVVQEAWNAAN